MSEHTAIAWTDATWNPWVGCTKVSEGCRNCYMYREQSRWRQNPKRVRRTAPHTFNAPLRWKEPQLVFTCSWSDFFHEAADGWRDEAWDIIRRTPHLTYQILTKRPERITAHLPADWGEGWPHVWLGVSIENQRFAPRVFPLINTPAVVRFLSCEPLLGPVDLDGIWGYPGSSTCEQIADWPIRWVIAGGESGPRARPMELEWARSLRDQSALAGVAFFLKQLGGYPRARAHRLATLDGRTWTEIPGGRP